MTKTEAISIFGGKVKDLAAGLGVTSSAVSQWPDGALPRDQADRVLGAAVRLGLVDGAMYAPEGSEGGPIAAPADVQPLIERQAA